MGRPGVSVEGVDSGGSVHDRINADRPYELADHRMADVQPEELTPCRSRSSAPRVDADDLRHVWAARSGAGPAGRPTSAQRQ